MEVLVGKIKTHTTHILTFTISTNACTQSNTCQKIQFMACIKLLYVLALRCHPQGVYRNNTIQVPNQVLIILTGIIRYFNDTSEGDQYLDWHVWFVFHCSWKLPEDGASWCWNSRRLIFVMNCILLSGYVSWYGECGASGGAIGWGTALQAGRLWVRFPMVSLEFFIDIILPAALWPWGQLNLYQKWVPGIFPGG